MTYQSETLDETDKVLYQLRNELYQGSWKAFEDDLKERREGRPYIAKLVNRIDEDLERISRLSEMSDSELEAATQED
jgi:hypothetical protein